MPSGVEWYYLDKICIGSFLLEGTDYKMRASKFKKRRLGL